MDTKIIKQKAVVEPANAKPARPRFIEIDLLKAFAALLVIFIHVSSGFIKLSEFHLQAWDYAHFAVGSFVFASGFLLGGSEIAGKKIRDYLTWAYKRFIRIYVPYLLFLPPMFLANAFRKGWVSGEGLDLSASWDWVLSTLNWEYWIRTFIMETGGVGNSWIPRLFLWLSLIYLFAQMLRPYLTKYYYLLFGIASVVVSFLSLYFSTDLFQRDQNIFGWGVILLFGMFVAKNYSKYNLITMITMIITPVIFYITWQILEGNGDKTTLFSNKYPPTLFFLAYNIFAILFVLSLFRYMTKWVEKSKVLQSVVNFYSQASYDIFFYHLVVMQFLFMMKFGLVTELLVITLVTTAVVYFKRNILKITT